MANVGRMSGSFTVNTLLAKPANVAKKHSQVSQVSQDQITICRYTIYHNTVCDFAK
jgi:hypothetical protein